MCLGQTPSPKILPDASPTPEEPPKAPVLPEGKGTGSATRSGRDSLRINLNPGLIL